MARTRAKAKKTATSGLIDIGALPAPGQPAAGFESWMKARRSDLRGSGQAMSPAVCKMIVGGVAAIGSLTAASSLAGLTIATVRKWMDIGHAEMEKRQLAISYGQDPGPPGDHELFMRDVLLAVGWWQGRLVGIVQRDAEQGSVKSARWLLERVGPKMASRRLELDELGNMGGQAGEGPALSTRAELLDRLGEIRGRRRALLGDPEDGPDGEST